MASERGRGQTEGSNIFGVTDRHHDQRYLDERHGKAGETVLEPRSRKRFLSGLDPEYHGTRETLWEVGGTTLQA